MAYQITDDVLDYVATAEKWGKPRGNDLAQGKQTLPLVYAYAKADPADREELLSQLRNGRDMAKVLPVIEKTGGLKYATERARSLAGEAEKLIPTFEPNASESLFGRICQYAVERTY